MKLLKIGDCVGFVALDRTLPSVPVSPDRWTILRVHPLRERQVQERLARVGKSCYVPHFPKQVIVARQYAWQKPIVQRRTVPLFPGLVFIADFDATDMYAMKRVADGIVGYLLVDGRAATLKASMYDDIREIEADLNTPLSVRKRRMRGLTVGSTVEIRQGNQFAGWIGRIGRLDDSGRIRVLISAMKREVAITMDVHQVDPVEQATVC